VAEDKIFKSTHTANYKQVIEFGADPSGKDDVNLMSIDTGMGGNLFGGNYFTMNQGHLRGELPNISTNFRALEQNKNHYVLNIKPLREKKKRVTRPLEEALVDEKRKTNAPTDASQADPDDDWAAAASTIDPEDPDGINEHYRKKDAEAAADGGAAV